MTASGGASDVEPVARRASRVVRDHLLAGTVTGRCVCGWGQEAGHLGRWHSDHVVEQLRLAGLLREDA